MCIRDSSQIVHWKDVDKLWSLAHFVAVTRPNHQINLKDIPSDVIDILEVPALAISSTDIRNRASKNEPTWYLVPDGVVQYITKHQLYKG